MRGHTVANLAAVEGIPIDGPVFLKAQEAYIGHLGTIPDTWRGYTEPYLRISEELARVIGQVRRTHEDVGLEELWTCIDLQGNFVATQRPRYTNRFMFTVKHSSLACQT